MLGFTLLVVCKYPLDKKLHMSCNIMEMVGAGAMLIFVHLTCSIIAKDVEASSAAAAPSRGWFYVDRAIHQFEYVILAKILKKRHVMS